MKLTKVIFMGTPELALPSLQALIDDPHFEISAVVTQEDQKIGRKQVLTPPPVKKLALQHNLPVLQPNSLKENGDFFTLIKHLQPDFIVAVVYGNILPKTLLEIPSLGAINIHLSLLPKYRGASPFASALLNGEKETGITFIKMNEKLDGGNVLFMQKISIEKQDNSASLGTKLALLGAKFLPHVLKDIEENNIRETPQNELLATYCHKIKKSDGLIDFATLTAEEISNRIRAYAPWPSCFIFCGENETLRPPKVNGEFHASAQREREQAKESPSWRGSEPKRALLKRLKIIEADIDMEKNITPGSVIDLTKSSIGIGTKKGLLIPKKVQLEGKKAITIQEFLAGNRELLRLKNRLPGQNKQKGVPAPDTMKRNSDQKIQSK